MVSGLNGGKRFSFSNGEDRRTIFSSVFSPILRLHGASARVVSCRNRAECVTEYEDQERTIMRKTFGTIKEESEYKRRIKNYKLA